MGSVCVCRNVYVIISIRFNVERSKYMENVEQFIDQIINEKGYTSLDEDVRAQLKADLTQRLLDQIDTAAIYALPEEKAVELSQKLDDPNFGDEQVTEFMAQSGVDLQDVALKTMLQFRALYIGQDKVNAANAAAVAA